MVYIHGGAYTMGSSYDSTPNDIMDEDVVLVSVQYRLSALGAWCFEWVVP